MKLIKGTKADVNYLAKVVDIKGFTRHPNPKVEKMKIAHIGGYGICVGINEQPGLYVYFPTLSQINENLLAYCNLYRDKELNKNPEDKPGFFEKNGRVKAIKLQGFPSEGFLLPYEQLQSWILSEVNIKLPEAEDGTEFNEVEHDGKTFWVCKKYIVPEPMHPFDRIGRRNKRAKIVKRFDRLREDQFRFHYDTVLIKKEPNVISPNDLISITEKVHGTSGISSYILCHKKLSLKEKIAKWLTKELFDVYDYIYASRSVIKNQYYNSQITGGYYNCNVWEKADSYLRKYLVKGMTYYYEIVGYLPNGSYIQKNYDYGCIPPENEYIEGLNYKIYIYRITTTNVEGVVHEWSAREVQQWCKFKGLRPVTELYYGYAKDLYPQLNTEEHWNENFLECLANDKNFYMEELSPSCNNKVPHEGIVIKKEDSIPHAWKLKTFAFLRGEQIDADKGEANIEDNA